MRCDACNNILTPREDSRRSVRTGMRIGLCDPCFIPIADNFHMISEDPLADDIPSKDLSTGSLVESIIDTSHAYFNEDVKKQTEKSEDTFQDFFETSSEENVSSESI